MLTTVNELLGLCFAKLHTATHHSLQALRRILHLSQRLPTEVLQRGGQVAARQSLPLRHPPPLAEAVSQVVPLQASRGLAAYVPAKADSHMVDERAGRWIVATRCWCLQPYKQIVDLP